MYNIKLFYEKYRKQIFIILILMNLFFIYPYLMNTMFPKTYFEDLPFGKFYLNYIHGSEFSDKIFAFSYLFLNLMVIYEIYKREDLSMTTKLVIYCLIIYLYTLILIPLIYLYNFYLNMFYNNPAYIEDINGEFEKNIILENNFEVYHDELMKFMKSKEKINCIHEEVPGFIINKTENKCWRLLHIKTANTFIPKFDMICPELYKLLDDNRIYNVFLSILDGKVNIPIHTGYSRSFLRYHIGVTIPIEDNKKPFIVCNNIKY